MLEPTQGPSANDQPSAQVPLPQGLPLLQPGHSSQPLLEPSTLQPQLPKPSDPQKPSAKAPRLLMEASPNDRSLLDTSSLAGDEPLQPSAGSQSLQPPAGSQRAIAVMIPSPRQAEQTTIDQAKPTLVETPSTNETTPPLRRSQRLAIGAPPID